MKVSPPRKHYGLPKGNICVTDIKKSDSEKLVEIKIDFKEHFSGVIKSSTMHKLTGELCLKSFPLFYSGLAIYLFIYLYIHLFIYLFIIVFFASCMKKYPLTSFWN